MYRDIITNLSLIIATVSILGHIFKNKPMKEKVQTKIVGGVFMGILGSILFALSTPISDFFIVEFHIYTLMISSIYGGTISLIVSVILISLSRFLILEFQETTYINFILLSLIIPYIYLGKKKVSILKKFIYMSLTHIFLTFIFLILFSKNLTSTLDIMSNYIFVSFISTFILYFCLKIISQSNKEYREKKKLSEKDYLTGLNNVRHFNEIWEGCIRRTKKDIKELSLLLIDVDYFKNVNDKYGHSVGDKVLKEIGDILIKSTRDTDFVSRNGGEEFSIILPNCSREKAIEIGERIRSVVENYNFLVSNKESLNITISIGVATYPYTTSNLEEIIKLADKNLYQAKNNGRNQVCA